MRLLFSDEWVDAIDYRNELLARQAALDGQWTSEMYDKNREWASRSGNEWVVRTDAGEPTPVTVCSSTEASRNKWLDAYWRARRVHDEAKARAIFARLEATPFDRIPEVCGLPYLPWTWRNWVKANQEKCIWQTHVQDTWYPPDDYFLIDGFSDHGLRYVWVSPQRSTFLTYCEGDLTLVWCLDDQGFSYEVLEMLGFYGVSMKDPAWKVPRTSPVTNGYIDYIRTTWMHPRYGVMRPLADPDVTRTADNRITLLMEIIDPPDNSMFIAETSYYVDLADLTPYTLPLVPYTT